MNETSERLATRSQDEAAGDSNVDEPDGPIESVAPTFSSSKDKGEAVMTLETTSWTTLDPLD
jgi:hypothetical protein